MSLDLPGWFNFIGLKPLYPPPRHDIKDYQNKGTKKKSSPVKCENCQGYGHRVDTCAGLFRVVIIDGVPTVTPKLYSTILPVVTSTLKKFSDVSKEFQDKPIPICDTQPEIEIDSDEFIYRPDIDSDFDEDVDDDFADDQVDEELGDDIVQSRTLIFSEVTSVITGLVDIFPKNVTHNSIST